MNTLLKKVVAKLNNSKVHAAHTAIKGKLSSGQEDSSHYKNWKAVK